MKCVKLKFILPLLLVFISYNMSGQTVTKDPFNLIVNQASKLLQEKSLDELKASAEMYKEWRDTYKEVSAQVKKYQAVVEIYDYSKKIAAAYTMSVDELASNKFLSFDAKQKFMTVYTTALSDSSKKVAKMKTFITQGFEMSDAERISLLEDVRYGIKDDYSFILYVRSKILRASKKQHNMQRSKEMEDMITNFKS